MAVYTGILPMAKTEAGLAAVMGHEVVHALARHGAERMNQGQLDECWASGPWHGSRDCGRRRNVGVGGDGGTGGWCGGGCVTALQPKA
jgi:Peptidase family M48